MTKKMLDILNKFANTHILATNISVDITEHSTHLQPKDKELEAKYEDATLLMNILKGAEHFLWYLERNNYDIIKKRLK